MPIDHNGAGYSQGTDRKQHDFAIVAPAFLSIVGRILRKHRSFHPRCVYIDLTAGSGMVDGRIKGSPLLMLEAAARTSTPIDAYLIDESPGAVAELRHHLAAGGFDATVLEGDYRDRLHDVARALGATVRPNRWVLGLAYWDANADEPPWDTLIWLARTFPRLDLLLSVGAAYKKWQGAMKRREQSFLLDRLRDIGRKHIVVREPVEHGQWTLVLLSDADILAQREFRGQGFRRLDTPAGRVIGDVLNLTKPQLRAKYQPPLFPEAPA
jgi:three-Cys-motif partner protein